MNKKNEGVVTMFASASGPPEVMNLVWHTHLGINTTGSPVGGKAGRG